MTAEYKTKKRITYFTYPGDFAHRTVATSPDATSRLVTDISQIRPLRYVESITTRGNPGWNHKGPGSFYEPGKQNGKYANSDRGGNVTHQKYTFDCNPYPMRRYVGGYGYDLMMPLFPDAWAMSGPSEGQVHGGEIAPWSDASMDALGSKLVSFVSPTRPKASLFTTLVELRREGLPTLRSALLKNRNVRGAAEDWLNFSFGIKPLWNDLQALAKSLLDAEALLLQFERDAGRLVRRKVDPLTTLISDVILEDQPNSYGYPMGTGAAYNKLGTHVVSQKRTRETWFSGAFKYSIPRGDSLLAQLKSLNQESRYLLGLSFDPKTLWSVLGWSWLVDWVFNVGPVLENFTQSYMNDSVLAYGYVMCRETEMNTRSISGLIMNAAGGGIYMPSAEMTYSQSTFKRRQATPFGFGSSWNDFSPFQLSILVSLGITHRRP